MIYRQKYLMVNFDDTTPTRSQKLHAVQHPDKWFWIVLIFALVLLVASFFI